MLWVCKSIKRFGTLVREEEEFIILHAFLLSLGWLSSIWCGVCLKILDTSAGLGDVFFIIEIVINCLSHRRNYIHHFLRVHCYSVSFIFLSSQVFFLVHDKNYKTSNRKVYRVTKPGSGVRGSRVPRMIILVHFTHAQSK